MATTLCAGAARVDITPPVGSDIQGYLGDGGAVGVFDRLYTKAIAFDNGRKKAILIAADLIGVSPELTAWVRQVLTGKITGLAPADVMVCATHTHCGPTVLPGVVGRRRGTPAYLRRLRRAFVEVALAAWANREPTRIGTGSGRASFNINRRLKTPQGVQMLPNPEGPCDHEVGVLRIDNAKGEPKAIVMNFCCHPTTWGDRWISPDYPGFAQKLVEEQYRGKVVTLFTNGAAGDVRPCTVKGPNPKAFGGGTSRWAVRLGNVLGREVLRVARTIKTEQHSTIKGVSRIARLPLEKLRTLPQWYREIREARATLRQYRNENKDSGYMMYGQIGLDWATNARRLLLSGQFKPWVNGEIQVLRIGDVLLVGLPGEIFCDIGLAIKRLFKGQPCFVIGYANANVGYVPTAKALADGGYETDRAIMSYNQPSRFAPRVEEVLLDQAAKLGRTVCR